MFYKYTQIKAQYILANKQNNLLILHQQDWHLGYLDDLQKEKTTKHLLFQVNDNQEFELIIP